MCVAISMIMTQFIFLFKIPSSGWLGKRIDLESVTIIILHLHLSEEYSYSSVIANQPKSNYIVGDWHPTNKHRGDQALSFVNQKWLYWQGKWNYEHIKWFYCLVTKADQHLDQLFVYCVKIINYCPIIIYSAHNQRHLTYSSKWTFWCTDKTQNMSPKWDFQIVCTK